MEARPLAAYWRTTTPDREVAPQEPTRATPFRSFNGTPFTLVREAVWSDDIGRMCSWLIWRGSDCVGYLGTSLPTSPWRPFEGAPLATRRGLNNSKVFKIWKCFITNGRDERFAPVPSRGLGIMTTAYLEIVRAVSRNGWALASSPRARSSDAKRLWSRLSAATAVEIVRGRDGASRANTRSCSPRSTASRPCSRFRGQRLDC